MTNSFRTNHRLVITVTLALLIIAAPVLFASHGPVPEPTPYAERLITYYTCASGTPQYTGFQHWYYCPIGFSYGTDGNTFSTYAIVEDDNCYGTGYVRTHYCKRSNGTWKVISESEFQSCATCS